MSTLLKIEFDIVEEKADEAGVFVVSRVPHGWEETPIDGGRHFTMYLEDHPLGMEMVREFQAHFPNVDIKHSEEESEDWAMAWKDFFNPVNCGETFKILPRGWKTVRRMALPTSSLSPRWHLAPVITPPQLSVWKPSASLPRAV